MKNFILLNLLTLFLTVHLIAQNGFDEQKQESSQGDWFPRMMMDPAEVNEGVEALGKVLGISETPGGIDLISSTSASSGSVNNRIGTVATFSNVPHEVFRLKGGAGDDEEEDLNVESEGVREYLSREICDNIYAICLAKVADSSWQERQRVEAGLTLDQAEEREWSAAKTAAELDVKRAERVLERAKQEVLEVKEAAASDNEIEIKKLLKNLADAKVETAHAVLKAISVKKTALSKGVEEELAIAKANEMKAYDDAVEAAQANPKGKVSANRRNIFLGIGMAVVSYVAYAARAEPFWSGFTSRFVDPDYYQSHKFAHDVWSNAARAQENANEACLGNEFDQNNFSSECLQSAAVAKLSWDKALEAKSDALQKASWAPKVKQIALTEEIKVAQNEQKYWAALKKEATKAQNTLMSLPTNVKIVSTDVPINLADEPIAQKVVISASAPSKPTSVPTVKKVVLKAPFDQLEDQWTPFAQAVQDFNKAPTVTNARAAQKTLYSLRDTIKAIKDVGEKNRSEKNSWQGLYADKSSYNKLLGAINAAGSVVDIAPTTMQYHIAKNALCVTGSAVSGSVVGVVVGSVIGGANPDSIVFRFVAKPIWDYFPRSLLIGYITGPSYIVTVAAMAIGDYFKISGNVFGTAFGAMIGADYGIVIGAVIAPVAGRMDFMDCFQTAASKAYQARTFANGTGVELIRYEWVDEDLWARRAADEIADFAELVSKTKFEKGWF